MDEMRKDHVYEELKSAKSIVVGTKQTVRALMEDDVSIIYLASDIDGDVKQKIFTAVGEADVHLVYVESKEELGRECGIEVPCACAAVLRHGGQ